MLTCARLTIMAESSLPSIHLSVGTTNTTQRLVTNQQFDNDDATIADTRRDDLTTVADDSLNDVNNSVKEQIVSQYKVERRVLSYEDGYEHAVLASLEWAQSVAIFRDIVRARNAYAKATWIVCAFIAAGLCIYFMADLTGSYLDGPTNTRIRFRRNQSMEFPLVTVCTYSRVNQSVMDEMDVSDALLAYMFSTFKGTYLYYNEYNQRMAQHLLDREYLRFAESNLINATSLDHTNQFSLTQFFLDHGFKCHEFLRNCMFQGTEFPCCFEDVVIDDEKETVEERPLETVLTDVGKCFVVSSERHHRRQAIPGPNGGLKLYINALTEFYPHTMANTNIDAGIQVHIMHPSRKNYIQSLPLVMAPGTHAMVSLAQSQRVLSERASGRGTQCLTDEMIDQPNSPYRLNFFDAYSYESCYAECIAKLTQKTCGCVQIGNVPKFEYLSRFDHSLCSPVTATVCVQPLLQANNMGYLWDMYDISAECICPIKCNQWEYTLSVSFSQVPNVGYDESWAERVKVNTPTQDVKLKDFIVVDIFFPELVYTVVQEVQTQTLQELMSNLGGQMWLWLGVHIMAFIHMARYGVILLVKIMPFHINTYLLQRLTGKAEAEKKKEDEEDNDDTKSQASLDEASLDGDVSIVFDGEQEQETKTRSMDQNMTIDAVANPRRASEIWY